MITEQTGFLVVCVNPAKSSIEKCWFADADWTQEDAISHYCTDYGLDRSDVAIETED